MWNKLNSSMMFVQMMFGLAYYGVMVILTRYFLDDLGYSEADTMLVVGAFSAIGPLFSIAGGTIADKLLGANRSLNLGYVSFAAGYALLAVGAMSKSVPLSLTGIAALSYARGMMFPSYQTQFKKTFASQEDFENAYPVNYSVNNLGALLGQYLYPLFVLYIGFKGGFLLSAGFSVLAVITLLSIRKGILARGEKLDVNPVSAKNWLIYLAVSAAMIALVFFMFSNMEAGQIIVYIISGLALLYFAYLMVKSDRATGLRMGTILIMVTLTIAFFVYYGQMMTAMTMTAINTMRGDLFGIIPIEPEASMAMNPLWCMVAGPVLAWLFSTLEKRGIEFAPAVKVGFAFILTAIAFGVLTMAVLGIGEDVVIRPEIYLIVHFFQAFAEVIIGTLVVAFILSVAPKAISNFSVSLFTLAMALAGIIGAVFSTNIALEKGQELTQELAKSLYGDYYMLLTILAVVMVVVAFIASFIISKMLKAADEWDRAHGVVRQDEATVE